MTLRNVLAVAHRFHSFHQQNPHCSCLLVLFRGRKDSLCLKWQELNSNLAREDIFVTSWGRRMFRLGGPQLWGLSGFSWPLGSWLQVWLPLRGSPGPRGLYNT